MSKLGSYYPNRTDNMYSRFSHHQNAHDANDHDVRSTASRSGRNHGFDSYDSGYYDNRDTKTGPISQILGNPQTLFRQSAKTQIACMEHLQQQFCLEQNKKAEIEKLQVTLTKFQDAASVFSSANPCSPFARTISSCTTDDTCTYDQYINNFTVTDCEQIKTSGYKVNVQQVAATSSITLTPQAKGLDPAIGTARSPNHVYSDYNMKISIQDSGTGTGTATVSVPINKDDTLSNVVQKINTCLSQQKMCRHSLSNLFEAKLVPSMTAPGQSEIKIAAKNSGLIDHQAPGTQTISCTFATRTTNTQCTSPCTTTQSQTGQNAIIAEESTGVIIQNSNRIALPGISFDIKQKNQPGKFNSIMTGYHGDQKFTMETIASLFDRVNDAFQIVDHNQRKPGQNSSLSIYNPDAPLANSAVIRETVNALRCITHKFNANPDDLHTIQELGFKLESIQIGGVDYQRIILQDEALFAKCCKPENRAQLAKFFDNSITISAPGPTNPSVVATGKKPLITDASIAGKVLTATVTTHRGAQCGFPTVIDMQIGTSQATITPGLNNTFIATFAEDSPLKGMQYTIDTTRSIAGVHTYNVQYHYGVVPNTSDKLSSIYNTENPKSDLIHSEEKNIDQKIESLKARIQKCQEKIDAIQERVRKAVRNAHMRDLESDNLDLIFKRLFPKSTND